MANYVVESKVRQLVKEYGKRTSAEFMNALDLKVEKLIRTACGVHNGGKVTLDNTIAAHVLQTTGRAQ